MWTAVDNADYGNRITGIGRDADGALNQKQSKSQIDGANVTVALGDTIKETNASNDNTIINDKSFFVFGDNGEEGEFTTELQDNEDQDLMHIDRIYKVEKTINFANTNLTFGVDKIDDAEDYPLYLVVSEDDEFTKADSFYELTDGKVTIESHKLANGAYFTVAAHVPVPEEAVELVEGTDGKITITIPFDEDVALTNGEGFTVKVDNVDLTGAIFTVDPTDPKKVIITLPTGTDVTDKEVKISYNGTGNLKGTNGVPVNGFEKVAEDSFAAALTITKPDAQVTVSKPEITGTAEAGSEVKVIIKKKDGTEIVATSDELTVDEDGKWTFTPSEDLEDGEYTVEVTATKDGKTATKTKDFTIFPKQLVDYTEVTGVRDVDPDGVTYNETGQFEVPSGVEEFTFKDGDKEKKATKDPTMGEWTFTEKAVVDKEALQNKYDEVKDLTSSPYTAATWGLLKRHETKQRMY